MLTQYHVQILSEALADCFSPRALRAITAANKRQDRLAGQFGHDEYHVDNNSFKESDAYLEEQRALTISSLKSNEVHSAWSAFGKLTHTVQDFYAHSNYITLWLSNSNGTTHPAPDEVDPIEPMVLNSPDLHSGKVYYPLELFYFIKPIRRFVLPLIPRDSHAWMNLDSPEQGFKFEYAIQAAIKRTKIEFDKTTLGFSDEMLRLFLDR